MNHLFTVLNIVEPSDGGIEWCIRRIFISRLPLWQAHHTHTHITLIFMYQQLELDSLFTTFSSLITLGQPARAAVPMYLSMEKGGQWNHIIFARTLRIDWNPAVGRTYHNKSLAALGTSSESIYHRRTRPTSERKHFYRRWRIDLHDFFLRNFLHRRRQLLWTVLWLGRSLFCL